MIRTDKDKPIHVIVNPHSGYGGQRHILADLLGTLRRADLDVVE